MISTTTLVTNNLDVRSLVAILVTSYLTRWASMKNPIYNSKEFSQEFTYQQ